MESYQSLLLFFTFSSLMIFNSAHALRPISLLRYVLNSDASPSLLDSQPPQVVAPSPDPYSDFSISIPPVSFPPLESISPSATAQPLSESGYSLISSLMKVVPLSTITNPALEKICRTTEYPAVCIEAIAPYLHGKTDPATVVGFAITAAAKHTKLAVSAAERIIKSPATPGQMKSVVSDCKGSYSDALFNFDSAMKALRSLDVGTMNSMLSAAITDFSDCDDGLTGQRSPLLEFDTKLTKMTSNCLAIVSLIP